jgi:glycosyltransferase involved in cell wall biosynthesis
MEKEPARNGSPAKNSQRLSIIVPAYNEADGIAQVIERVQAVAPRLESVGAGGFELIIVDDGSRDATAEVVAAYPGVRLIRHPVNRGYGAALKTGFRHADGDLLAFLDADGTYPPEWLPQLCSAAIEQGVDLVVGSRMSGQESRMPWIRRLGNGFFAFLLSLISSAHISDSASGMRVIRREALPKLYPLPDGLNFTPVMSTRALHENLKVAEVAIPYEERVGRSKLSVVHDGQRFLRSIIWTALTYNPVRIVGTAGLAQVLLAVLIFLGLAIAHLLGWAMGETWTAFALFFALVLVVSGISVFSLGATFNYLVSLFHKRPMRQGIFDPPLFNPSLDYHFGWMGLLSILGGGALGMVCVALGASGWPVSSLWFYLLGSAVLILIGVQLVLSWVLMRALEELSKRETLVEEDLGRNPAS